MLSINGMMLGSPRPWRSFADWGGVPRKATTTRPVALAWLVHLFFVLCLPFEGWAAADGPETAGGGPFGSPFYCGGYRNPVGDCNRNGHREISDIRALANCMTGPTVLVSCTCVCGDWNGDGRVALDDYAAALLARPGHSPLAFGATSVAQTPSYGFCPKFGNVFNAQIVPMADGRYLLIGSELLASDPDAGPCDVSSWFEPFCGVVRSFEPRILDAEHMETLDQLRSLVPVEGCQPDNEDPIAIDWCLIIYVGGVGDSACAFGGNSEQYSESILNIFRFIDGIVREANAPKGMVFIPGGEFEMGDHHDEMSWALPVHQVRLSPFYMSRYEITNVEFAAGLNWAMSQGGLIEVVDGIVYRYSAYSEDCIIYCDTQSSLWRHCYSLPDNGEGIEVNGLSRITWDGSSFGAVAGKGDHPVAMVTWHGAAAYANWRSQMEGRTPCFDTSTWTCDFAADGYRLPREAEWEYAARGGLHNPYRRFPWGNTLDGSRANYGGSGDPYETGAHPWTTPVGYYLPNGYGLYDMSGNVNEWIFDSMGDYPSASQTDPQGPQEWVLDFLLRGGSWETNYFSRHYLTCASRQLTFPDLRNPDVGFRLVLNAE